MAKGKATVVADDAAYLLKFRLNLSKEDFLSCAFYAFLFNCKKGVLWNVYDNSVYEITINDKTAFLNQVAVTISMGVLDKYYPVDGYGDNYFVNNVGVTQNLVQSTYSYSPAMLAAKAETGLCGIKAGTKVRHKKFGEGVITSIDKVKKHVDITFSDGEKTFLLDCMLNFLEIL